MSRAVLKSHPDQFEPMHVGMKRFDVRYDDRCYESGDLVRFYEYEPEAGKYSGRWIDATVLHVQREPSAGIAPGYVGLSLELTARGVSEHARAA